MPKAAAPYRILISGGGTGGHVFPAIAIANALKELDKETVIQFVGAQGRLEMTKVPEAGYPIEGLWISGLQRGKVVENLSLPFKILSSLNKAGSIVKKFKPDAAVGVGGYASLPTLYMASRKGVPTLIQEQNSYAGMTNKYLANRADRFCVAYDKMDRFFPAEKIINTGNPVRALITEMEDNRWDAVNHFGLRADKKTILAIGGSLGARTINESLAGKLKEIEEAGMQLLWQTGKTGIEEAKAAAEGFEHIHPNEFIKRMDLAYGVADIIISRAGAISISELCMVKKPVILVPSPNVTEDHQTKNALALVEKDAALLIKDVEARETLVKATLELAADEGKQEQLSKNIAALAIPDAAKRIANEIIQLIENGHQRS